MQYLGDYTEDYATMNFKFATHKADGTPITLAGTPVVSCYKGSSTIQTTLGMTIGVDFDGVTGLHAVTGDLSADAFYSTGADYSIVLTAGTVDGVSVVGAVLANFSIQNRYSTFSGTVLGVTNPVTVGSGTISAGTINTVTTTISANVVQWNGSAAPDLSDDTDIANAVWATTLSTLLDVTVSSRASGTTWSTALAAKLDTTLSTLAPSATALSSATWTDAKAGYLDVAISSRASGTTWTTAIANRLDTTLSTLAPASTALSNVTWTDAKAAFIDSTISSISGGGSTLTTTAIADAVWDEAIAGHLGAGTTGAKLNTAAAAAGAGGTAWTYTLTDAVSGLPIAGCAVWVTTDSAGNNVVASGTTDAFGQVTFYLDAGTYYIWRSVSGYDFSNPQVGTLATTTGTGTVSTSGVTTPTTVGLGFIPTS